MTKIKVILHWGLKNLKTVDVPTPFYKESWGEVLNEKLKPTLAVFVVGNKAYRISYHQGDLFLELDPNSPYIDQTCISTETEK